MAKFDWTKIMIYYISHLDCSYEDLSKRYSVSSTAIKEYQKRTGINWQKLRLETAQKASEKLPEKLAEDIAEIKSRHIQLSKALQRDGSEVLVDQVDEKGKLIKRITVKSPFIHKEARESIKDGVKMEREVLGLDKVPLTVNAQQNNYITIQEANDRIRARVLKREQSNN